jgi:hypothetical protein
MPARRAGDRPADMARAGGSDATPAERLKRPRRAPSGGWEAGPRVGGSGLPPLAGEVDAAGPVQPVCGPARRSDGVSAAIQHVAALARVGGDG